MIIAIGIIGLLLFAISVSYQVHRRRTPFFVEVESDADSIEISVYRRGFESWPKGTRKDLGLCPTTVLNDYSLKVKKISVHDYDADEKMLEAVVACKTTIEKWKADREKSINLEQQARKALKR